MNPSLIIILLSLLYDSSVTLAVDNATIVKASVNYDVKNDKYSLSLGIDKTAPVYGDYLASQMTTGWGELNIVGGYATDPVYNDAVVIKAAGYLEGALTHDQMYSFYQNLRSRFFVKDMNDQKLEKVKQYFTQQSEWMKGMIAKNTSTYWYYVGLINEQFEGLKLGYNDVASPQEKLQDWEFAYIAANGDYLDMANYIFDKKIDYDSMTKEEILNMIYMNGHCSVLIKVLPGYENIYASHASWYMYEAMNRIYKHYAFNLQDKHAATQVMSFSSFPGVLSSWDDFYIMDSKLMMLQTTNNIFDSSLYKYSVPQSLFSWHRVRLANWLASDGKSWSVYVSEYNSGTYNNQYMILDLKKINISHGIDDGALWVVEQIPGYVEYGDQTSILREGYWASYNVPFYEKVYNMSGYPRMVHTAGPLASHDLAARAKIFRRDQGKVKDIDSMKYMMRYNKYKTDPYSDNNSMEAICSRGDLSIPPSTSGCIDTKISDYSMALNMTSIALSGPTSQDLSPFQWSKSTVSKHAHLGQPDLFDFDFVTMKPKLHTE